MSAPPPACASRKSAPAFSASLVRLCCPQCDYSLREIPEDLCPECGFRFTAPAVAAIDGFIANDVLRPLRRSAWLAAIALLLGGAAFLQFAIQGNWSTTPASPALAVVFTAALATRQVWVSSADRSAVRTATWAFVSILVLFSLSCMPFGLLLLALVYSAHALGTLLCVPPIPAALSLDWSQYGWRVKRLQYACWGMLVATAMLEISGLRTLA